MISGSALPSSRLHHDTAVVGHCSGHISSNCWHVAMPPIATQVCVLEDVQMSVQRPSQLQHHATLKSPGSIALPAVMQASPYASENP